MVRRRKKLSDLTRSPQIASPPRDAPGTLPFGERGCIPGPSLPPTIPLNRPHTPVIEAGPTSMLPEASPQGISMPRVHPLSSSPPPSDVESEGWETESSDSGDDPLWGESHYRFLTGYRGPGLNAGRRTPGGSDIYGDPVEFDLLEDINDDLVSILLGLLDGDAAIFQAVQGAPGRRLALQLTMLRLLQTLIQLGLFGRSGAGFTALQDLLAAALAHFPAHIAQASPRPWDPSVPVRTVPGFGIIPDMPLPPSPEPQPQADGSPTGRPPSPRSSDHPPLTASQARRQRRRRRGTPAKGAGLGG
jgi:hypothetical protein